MSDKYSRIEVKRFKDSPEDIEMIIVDKQILPCNDEEGRWILYEVMTHKIRPEDLPLDITFEIWDRTFDEVELPGFQPIQITRLKQNTIQAAYCSRLYNQIPWEKDDNPIKHTEVLYQVAQERFEVYGDISDVNYEAYSWILSMLLETQFEKGSGGKNQYPLIQNKTDVLPIVDPYEDGTLYENPLEGYPLECYEVFFSSEYQFDIKTPISLMQIIRQFKEVQLAILVEAERRLGVEREYSVKTEEEFTICTVIPLLRDLGFEDVQYTHGVREYGKDVFFKRRTEFGTDEYWAAQVKFGDISGNSTRDIDNIIRQIDDAFGIPIENIYTKRKDEISKVAVIISGVFKNNAKEKIIHKIHSPAKRGNVEFIDGAKLEELKRKVYKHSKPA
jgi:hypothetical protein